MSANFTLGRFMLLAIIGGIAIGMGRVVTTFYALDKGATDAQIGYIAVCEAIGRLLVTLPAGFIIARYGARRIYAISSLVPMLLNALMPWVNLWYTIALLRGLIALAVPFRVVSMNSAFLHYLSQVSVSRAGWYRGSQTFGMMILGPFLASVLLGSVDYLWCYALIAALFGVMVFGSGNVLPGEAGATVQPVRESSAESEALGTQLKQLWHIPVVKEGCVIEFINSAINTVFTTFIIVLAVNALSLSKNQAVSLLTLHGMAMVGASFVLGYLLNHFSLQGLQNASYVLSILGLGLLGLVSNFAGLIAGALMLACGSALVSLIKTLQLSKVSMDKGKISGVYNLFTISGSLVGALAGSILGQYQGLPCVFLMWLPILAGLLLWGICLGKRQN
ncbi:MFS transporter [Cellvibrio japonicus]|uniref:Tranpsorter, major facilitator family subfamily n=1 Tax=Cellvibrio japonicus (strain Ueda107) TaxID=498211 RepID=B3PJY8_CELJU|nr:MFS transporter [Cellvibrio japonicus]ACE86087.1 tranpsorter, major facilitator family subfamily [Cellvibrio japonicus Ueda107]QEI12759.1 MFS transporter [Cellvibrio japonicus]QEI16333.1 MFS transporter [Cellvibrio japonicus]QEI19911.1 MFS transporter [Cellvibrio japonicus]